LKKTISLLSNGLESSSMKTPELKAFFTQFKKEFKAVLAALDANQEVVITLGHFCISGFFKRGPQIWYFSLSDLRDPGLSEMLIRKAASFKDYKGEGNRWVSLVNLEENMRRHIC